jgi:spermidine/putrescine transport system permease protein
MNRQTRLAWLLFSPAGLILAMLLLVPLGIMIVTSLLEPGLYGGVSWSFYPYNYGRILGWPLGGGEEFDPIYMRIFGRSVLLALFTVLACLLLCYPIAFWVSGMSGTRKNLMLFLISLPFFANLLIRIYAWLLILRPTGILNTVLQSIGLIAEPLQLIFTNTAVVIGMVYVLVPFMFFPLFSNVERLDKTLISAAQDLGASPLQVLSKVILPLTMPGIVAGSIIVFIPALGNFIVPALLGGAKVMMSGNLIEQQFLEARNWPFGAAIAMTAMAAVLFALVIYSRIVTKQSAEFGATS